MGDKRQAAADLRLARHLSMVERHTIVVALRMLQLAEPTNQMLHWARGDMMIDEILNDDQTSHLMLELSDAHEVKVCRRKP